MATLWCQLTQSCYCSGCHVVCQTEQGFLSLPNSISRSAKRILVKLRPANESLSNCGVFV
jgi:hypothetical protein